jgi:hypothetical protein
VSKVRRLVVALLFTVNHEVSRILAAYAFIIHTLTTAVPKSYRIPTFLEELEAKVYLKDASNYRSPSIVIKVSTDGTVALECKVIGVPTPRLLWFKDDKELKAGDTYELR